MTKKMVLLALCALCAMTLSSKIKRDTIITTKIVRDYVPDILENGFEKTTLDMDSDYNGKVVATLVRKLVPDTLTHKAVLYIHGYNDYFFQTEMADEYIKHGYNFYALDLRKCGRSILPGQIKTDVRSLVEYYNEIDEALQIIHREKNSFVLLSGHSMGGLVASLYAEDRIGKERFDALFLNSPFFDWNMNAILKATVLSIIAKEGEAHPEKTRKSGGLEWYGESLNKNFKGEWNYSLEWKPLVAPDVTYGWVHAVYEGIKRVQGGLHIAKPVLVMHSDRSIKPKKWTDDLFAADAVLNVDDIHKYARNISTKVKIVEIPGGMHDLVLSRKPVRENVYKELFGYLTEIAPK
jgi:alpha-beta hydrolase superfamily lysophospholipase